MILFFKICGPFSPFLLIERYPIENRGVYEIIIFKIFIYMKIIRY